jgi:hypothetical protein
MHLLQLASVFGEALGTIATLEGPCRTMYVTAAHAGKGTRQKWRGWVQAIVGEKQMSKGAKEINVPASGCA